VPLAGVAVADTVQPDEAGIVDYNSLLFLVSVFINQEYGF